MRHYTDGNGLFVCAEGKRPKPSMKTVMWFSLRLVKGYIDGCSIILKIVTNQQFLNKTVLKCKIMQYIKYFIGMKCVLGLKYKYLLL